MTVTGTPEISSRPGQPAVPVVEVSVDALAHSIIRDGARVATSVVLDDGGAEIHLNLKGQAEVVERNAYALAMALLVVSTEQRARGRRDAA